MVLACGGRCIDGLVEDGWVGSLNHRRVCVVVYACGMGVEVGVVEDEGLYSGVQGRWIC